MLITVVVNLLRVRVPAVLNTFSAWWHMVGVLVLVLIIVPDQHKSVGYVFGQTINNSGFAAQLGGFIFFYVVLGLGLLMSQYTITGFDASAHMARRREGVAEAAWGMDMSVVVSVIFGLILLVAVTFAIPAPGRPGRDRKHRHHIWQTSMSQDGRNCCSSSLRRAVLLPTSVGHVRLPDDVRVLPRRRSPRPRDWGSASNVPGCPCTRSARSACLVPLMIPTDWNAYIGYLVGTSIAVIGLYIAFILPVILRWRRAATGSRAPGASEITTSGSIRSRSHGSRSSRSSSCSRSPRPASRSRTTRAGTGSSSTTHRSRSAVRSSSSEAGTCSRPTSGSRDRFARAAGRGACADRSRLRGVGGSRYLARGPGVELPDPTAGGPRARPPLPCRRCIG